MMRCIFCKQTEAVSNTVEHIIPESLGNKTHVLNNGLVCKKCNQYFSIKIEKKVLEKPYFISVRHRNFIESKKNRFPKDIAIISGDDSVRIDLNSGEPLIVVNNLKTKEKITQGIVKQMLLPTVKEPEKNDRDVSRFLGKMAIEILAYEFVDSRDWLEEITDKKELEPLKRYVRFGDKPKYWEYHQRRLYNEEDRFFNPKIQDEPYEVLHEFILLYTEKMEMYLVIVIMGIEYTINLADHEISGYEE